MHTSADFQYQLMLFGSLRLFLKSQPFLMRLIISNRMIAPINAVINEPISPPPPEMPTKPNRNPPNRAPMHPTIILPIIPKPLPFINKPASHPATAPIIKNQMKFIVILLH